MKVLQTKHYACCIEDTASLGEDLVVYVHHEITTIGKLHHKTHMLLYNHHSH